MNAINIDQLKSTIDSYLIEVFETETKNRSLKGINRIVQFIKTLQPFITYLHSNSLTKENNILILLSTQIKYRKIKHNSILKKACERNNNFYIILSGQVAEFAFKYDKLFVTEEEYLIHLIKLSLLFENELLNETIKLNKRIFNINTNIITWIKVNRSQCFDDYKAKAKNDISKAKQLFQSKDIRFYIKIAQPFIKSNINRSNTDNTNTNSNSNSNSIRIDPNTHYLLTLPSYCYIQTLSSGNHVGTLSLNKTHKTYSTFVAIQDTEIGVIEKCYASNPHLYLLIDNQIRDDLNTVTDSFFLFQTIQKKYFDTIICPQFTYRKIFKGEYLLRENCHYEGVYLIKNGNFKISTIRKRDELSELIVDLKHSLENHTNYMTDLKDNLIEDFPQQNFLLNHVYGTQEFLNDSKIRKEIVLSNVYSKQVIGLSEFYNYKTDIIHFNTKCISDWAEVYFLPKESFLSMINREKEAKERAAKVIEQNAKYYIQTIRRYKDQSLNDLKITIAKNSKRNVVELNKNIVFSQRIGVFSQRGLRKINSDISIMTDIANKNQMKRSFSQKVLSLVNNKTKKEETKKLFSNTFNEKIFLNRNRNTTPTVYPTLFSGLSNRMSNKCDKKNLLIKIVKRENIKLFPKHKYYQKF